MNLFQWVVLPILGLMILWDGYNCLFRKPTLRRDRMIRFIVWLAAAFAVYNPDFTSIIANQFGITYGKDLILYGFAFAFLITSFVFYSWTVRQEKQITQLVRHIAKSEARYGPTPGSLE